MKPKEVKEADLNASRNIVKNYLASFEGKSGSVYPSRSSAVNRPNVAVLLRCSISYKPPASVGDS